MHTKRGFSAFLVAAVLGTGMISTPGLAQSYPSRAVTLVIPFPPGGGADVLCRLVADKLRGSLGQPIVIDNRAGGGGNIGAESVARASPDGHTLLCAPDPIFTSHLLYSKLSFDPRAFEPVSVFALFMMGMVGRAELPFGNVSELIAYARAHPGKLTYASQGVGHFGHLMMEDLKLRAKLDILHVPYRGGVLAVNDMLAGQVDLLTGTLVSTIAQINVGKLKLLAPTGERRLAAFPNVPALPEAVPGLSADSWLALAAPSGTPKEVTTKLSAAVAQAVQMPDLKARFAELHSEPMGTTPEQMRDLIRRATEQWARVIAATKISIE
jgi:tripartite-type tricarboxylate transporter receptor subunit TctC